MDKKRLEAEIAVLSSRMPENLYRFVNLGTSDAHVIMGMKTNRGHVYSICIMLAEFPFNVPKVFVTKMLLDKKRHRLNEVSGAMHTLASEHGWTRICHYGAQSWTPRVSLFKVYVKCRLWLEMYELHLQTGLPIDYYLNHQR